MVERVEVFKKNELIDGRMREIKIAGHDILIARAGDNYYAVDNLCPHMGGKLSQGKLDGTVVTCPYHDSQFDLQNGQVIRWMNFNGFMSKVSKILKFSKPITTYDIKVVDETVYIEI